MAPDHAESLLAIGTVLLLAAFCGAGARRVRLPPVTGYLVAGLIVACLRPELSTPPASDLLDTVRIIAGGYVLYLVGSQLSWVHLRPVARSLACLAACTLVGGAGGLFVALLFTGWFEGDPWWASSWIEIAMLAAASTSSAPTVVLCIGSERTGGDLPLRTAIAASTLSCAAVLLSLIGLRAVQATWSAGQAAWGSVEQLWACAVIGLAAGLVFARVGTRSRVLLPACILAAIVALEATLELEGAVLVTSLIAGVTRANLVGAEDAPRSGSRETAHLAFAFLFASTTALVDAGRVCEWVLAAAALVGARTLGLWLAARVASSITGCPRLRSGGFLALLPQAGLPLLLVQGLDDPTGRLQALVLAVVLVDALVMPPLLARALGNDAAEA